MNISPDEAEEALISIRKMTQKTWRAIASSGAYIFLVITGIIWLIGFLATQFLAKDIALYIWIGISVLGSALSIFLGARMGRRVHSPSLGTSGKRAGIFWILLVFFCIATIAVARPADPRQITMFVILFIMIGQLAMGILLSFSSVWWALPITALALIGYFLLPGFFYLWMGILVGGGMIVLGIYIRLRW
jgi:hypothetical protein